MNPLASGWRGSDVPGGSGRPDLSSRSAIHDLVVGFYREVVFDDLLDPVFSGDVEVDWAIHIPKLIDYWCRVLLGEPGYAGLVLAAHRHVDEVSPLSAHHFDRWYELWVRAIDANWSGPSAERAKDHAARIGASLARHVAGTEWRPTLDHFATATEGTTS